MKLIMPWCCSIIHHWNKYTIKVFLQGPVISREDFCFPKAKKKKITFFKKACFLPEIPYLPDIQGDTEFILHQYLYYKVISGSFENALLQNPELALKVNLNN